MLAKNALNKLLFTQGARVFSAHGGKSGDFSRCPNAFEYPVRARVGLPAPDFKATAYHNGFKDISLSDYKGKYVVLFFYPLDFTFVCPTEIVAFNKAAEQFRKHNCEVIACSVDSHFSHMEWANKPRDQGGLGGMDIPILSDLTKEIGMDYGVLTPQNNIAFRGTFIISDTGILRHLAVNDLPVGRSVDEYLRLVKAFQHSDKHGEVCPAGWDEGKATMKPSHDEAVTKAYWKDELAK